MTTKADQDVCPHGLERRNWSLSQFDRPASPRQFVAFNADACPGCLEGRVRNLRKAIRLILSGSVPNPVAREAADRGMRLYCDDMRDHLGPSELPDERGERP